MRKDRVLAGALAAVTAFSMTACGGGQAGGTTQAAAAGTQAAAENTANPNAGQHSASVIRPQQTRMIRITLQQPNSKRSWKKNPRAELRSTCMRAVSLVPSRRCGKACRPEHATWQS
ncbi:MAG: hypothetical protein ACLRRF_06030 [Clostridium fessum]